MNRKIKKALESVEKMRHLLVNICLAAWLVALHVATTAEGCEEYNFDRGKYSCANPSPVTQRLCPNPLVKAHSVSFRSAI